MVNGLHLFSVKKKSRILNCLKKSRKQKKKKERKKTARMSKGERRESKKGARREIRKRERTGEVRGER